MHSFQHTEHLSDGPLDLRLHVVHEPDPLILIEDGREVLLENASTSFLKTVKDNLKKQGRISYRTYSNDMSAHAAAGQVPSIHFLMDAIEFELRRRYRA